MPFKSPPKGRKRRIVLVMRGARKPQQLKRLKTEVLRLARKYSLSLERKKRTGR